MKKKKCQVCKTEFVKSPHTAIQKYCSYKCSYEAQRKRNKKKTKTKRAEKKKLDNEWATQVKENAEYKCEYCKKETNLHSHHIFSRSKKSTRHLPENGICLCAGCHVFNSTFSAHKTPTEFTIWIIEHRGQEWYETLKQKAYQLDI